MIWVSSSAARPPRAAASPVGTPPTAGGSARSHTFRTTRSAPCSAASAAAHVSALRLPRDPSTPTRTVFHVATAASSSSDDERYYKASGPSSADARCAETADVRTVAVAGRPWGGVCFPPPPPAFF